MRTLNEKTQRQTALAVCAKGFFAAICLMIMLAASEFSANPLNRQKILSTSAGHAGEIASVDQTETYLASRAPWWEDGPPRVSDGTSLQTAIDNNVSLQMNGVGQDGGWGLWFTNSEIAYGQRQRRQDYLNAGIRSISYRESYGATYDPICEIGSGQPAPILNQFWGWQYYGGGNVKWAGTWTWFDNVAFARPFTRTHPVYGGQPMRYPDGKLASGFAGSSSDPRNSRVYDAGASKDILGGIFIEDLGVNEAAQKTGARSGQIWEKSIGKWVGMFHFSKDSSCPAWIDYARASTRFTVSQAGDHGAWTDNMGPWNSFAYNTGPVSAAFGDWSVSRFRAYLNDHFTSSQLTEMGISTSGGNLNTFDVRTFFKNVAFDKFGWDGRSLSHPAWSNKGWLDEPVWRAYMIFKRQTGSEAIRNYSSAVKQGAAASGNSQYLIMGNDISPANLGWARTGPDMVSSELSLGWNLATGSRGILLPPYGRLAPVYKAMREQAKSRFVNVWLYNGGFTKTLKLDPVVNAIYYEMLATHTTPKIAPGLSDHAGNPSADKAFFKFIKDKADPEFGARIPVEDVGIYYSTSSILSNYTPGGVIDFDNQQHLFALWGWGTALTELHYQYRFIPEWKLTPKILRTLKILIIPNATVFSPKDVNIVKSWVINDGGMVIVTGDSGSRLGETDNFDTSESLTLYPLTNVANYSSAPESTLQMLGKGAVKYLKSNIGFTCYLASPSNRPASVDEIMKEMTDLLLVKEQHVSLVSTNCPRTAGLTLYEDKKALKLFVDLNNENLTIAANGKSAKISPTGTISVIVYKPVWWGSAKVIGHAFSPSGTVKLAAPTVTADSITVQIPPTMYYTSVVLTRAPM